MEAERKGRKGEVEEEGSVYGVELTITYTTRSLPEVGMPILV